MRKESAAWRRFACRFLGADIGEARDDGSLEVSYEFSASPNRTDITIGDMTGIIKKGWDYIWVRYQDDVQGDYLVKRHTHVFCEKVYHSSDFDGLGIGT